MNTRIHFISFADSKMFNTLLRIKQEAETSGFFNKVDTRNKILILHLLKDLGILFVKIGEVMDIGSGNLI